MDLKRDDILVSELYRNGNLSPVIARKQIINYYKVSKGILYFLKYDSTHPDLSSNPIKKIGITHNLSHRLRILNTSCPYDISVERTWFVKGVGVELIESRIHNKFSDRKVKGEWFTDFDGKLLTNLLEYVEGMEDCELVSCD